MITPEQLAQAGTEHAEQCAFFQYLALNADKYNGLGKLMYAVPNGADYGGKASMGARMKAEGLKPGFPDMGWPVPCGSYAGLFIELKKTSVRDGRSDKQIEWHEALRAQHYAVVLAFGWLACVKAIDLYWDKRLVMPNEPGALFVR